ncbi:allatostatin-A receptor-like [Oculina patagonica]
MNGSNISASHLITSQDIVFATLYSFIVFFGVVGNGIVIIIVQKTPSMHTTTNYLLMNLAVADLLTLVFCPGFYDFALHNFQLSTTSGDIFCKLLAGNAVVCISFDASVLTLCVIAVERYIGIVKPFNSTGHLSRKNVCLTIAIIWLMAVISSFPDSLWTAYNSEEALSSLRYPCTRPWTVKRQPSKVKAYIISHSLVLIVLPSILISFCYISTFTTLKSTSSEPEENEESKQNMKRLLRLLVLLAVAFCILCLPFAGFFFYVASLGPNQVKQRFASLFLIHRIVRFLIFSNSFVNPILYAAQSTNYREVLQHELCCKTNTYDNGREATRAGNRRLKHEHADHAV